MKQVFDRSARTYDKCSFLQKELARLLANLMPLGVSSILELGCGTGHLTEQIMLRCSKVEYIAVDYSEQMIQMAKQKIPENVDFVLADIDSQDFWDKIGKFDLIISNAALQWSKDIVKLIPNLYFHLNKQGWLIFSIFGPNTFKELSVVFDMQLPAQGFVELDNLKLICQSYFDVVKFEVKLIRKEYNSLLDLLRMIKNTGTRGTRGFFLTPARLCKYEKNYRCVFGKIQVTYEVAIVVLRPKAVTGCDANY